MSDVCVFRDASQWHHVINPVTHPVPIHPIYGPVIHEAELRTQVKLWNKTCPPDKTAESLFVNRGQNLFLLCLFHAQDASMSPTFIRWKKKGDVQIRCTFCEAHRVFLTVPPAL